MKITIVGENLRHPSSFGSQTALLAKGFAEAGDKVTVLGGSLLASDNFHINVREITIPGMNLERIEKALEKAKPEAIICFSHLGNLNTLSHLKSAERNCPTFYWVPWEGIDLPKRAPDMWHQLPRNRFIHLTEYSKELWKEYSNSNVIIPHIIDETIFYSSLEKDVLREKWATKLRYPLSVDDIYVISVDRNDVRKRWDFLYSTIAEARRLNKRIRLIAHTDKRGEGQRGHQGKDLLELESLYGIAGSVAYTPGPLTHEDIAELYRISRYYLSTSIGEGFGLSPLEAALCGAIPVVPSHTAFAENLKGQVGLTETAGEMYMEGSRYGMPDCKEMGRFIAEVRSSDLNDLQGRIKSFSSDKVISKWKTLFSESQSSKYENVWGTSSQWVKYGSFQELASILNFFGEQEAPHVVEVGCRAGAFMSYCLMYGVNILGMEPDVTFIKMMKEHLRSYSLHLAFESSWPYGNIIVINDIFSRVAAEYNNIVEATSALTRVAQKICKYKWAFISDDDVHLWSDISVPKRDENMSRLLLHGMVRRMDLETLIKTKWKRFSHQIWQSGDNLDKVPDKLVKAM